MKREKILAGILITLCLGSACAIVSSCRKTANYDDSAENSGTNASISEDLSGGEAASSLYQAVYAQARELGYSGSLEEFIELVSGKDGTDGENGKSAYELAVENGYLGTETEWLESLKGADGVNGSDGENGVGIDSIVLDKDGNFVITYTDGTVQMLEHKWEYAYTLKAATCRETGIDIYTCADCGLARIVTVETGAHIYESEVTNATCEEDGYTTYTCTVCGYSYKDDIVASSGGHSFMGETCEVCGKSVVEAAIKTYDMSPDSNGAITGYIVRCAGGDYDVFLSGIGNMKDYTFSESPFFADGYAEKIKNIYIGEGITSIGTCAFYACRSLSDVRLPSSLIAIGDSAFQECTNLRKIVLPENVTDVGKCAFLGCRPLIDITIGDKITHIGSSAFNDTGYYTNHRIDKVLYLGKYLIEVDTSIEGNYRINEGILLIADYAFEDCENLTGILLPRSITAVGNYAFCRCQNFTKIYYSGTVEEWSKISVGKGNENLADTTVYYYSEAPAGQGSFWHYVNGSVTEWIYTAVELTILQTEETKYSYTPPVSGKYTFFFNDENIVIYDSEYHKLTGSVYLMEGDAYTVILANVTYGDITGILSIKMIEE